MPKLGFDEQKPDTRLLALGSAAMDAEAQYSFGNADGRSGEAREKETRLNLGGLDACRTNRLPQRQRGGMGGEKSAEAIVVGVHRLRTYSTTKGRIP